MIGTYQSQAKGDSTAFINPSGGAVYAGNNSQNFATTSDRRIKKNIVDNSVGLDKINEIQVRNFEYKTQEEIETDSPELKEVSEAACVDKKGVQLGVIAQELKEILPECVKEESTGIYTVDAENITWHLVNAVKELSAKVAALEAVH